MHETRELRHVTIAHFLTDPAALGLLRLLHGDRLDVYPKALRTLPVPSRWADGETDLNLAEAWGLSSGEMSRLHTLGASG